MSKLPNKAARLVGFPLSDGERLILACGHCRAELELWLTRAPPADRISTSHPSFALRWPEFLGVWRAVTPAKGNGKGDGPR